MAHIWTFLQKSIPAEATLFETGGKYDGKTISFARRSYFEHTDTFFSHSHCSCRLYTAAYIRICRAGAVFIVPYNVLGAVFRGMGDPKTQLLTVVIACAVNVTGDLLLVAMLHMGAAGAALATVAAQNMGAGQPQRARQAQRCAQGISFCFGVATFLLTFLTGDVLASVFDQDPAVITATQQYLKSSGFEYLITPLTFCFLGYFNGREHTGFVMFQGLFSAFLVRVPASYLLSRLPGAGMFTIGLAVPISALCSILFCLAFFLYLQRKEPPICGSRAG